MLNRILFGSLATIALFAGSVSGQNAQALKVGDQAPDFVLEGVDGKKVKLSDRFGEDGHPVVLLFSRANW